MNIHQYSKEEILQLVLHMGCGGVLGELRHIFNPAYLGLYYLSSSQ